MMHDAEGSQATAMLGDAAARCGLCGGAGRPGRELISPCRCTGPRQWVHRQCLDRERHAATKERPFLFTECGECRFQYIVTRRARDWKELADAHERHRQRQRRATWWVVEAFLGLLSTVLLVVAALACVLKLLDPQGLLVNWWNLSEQAGAPEDDFWHAVKEHKTTYMLSSSVLLLVLAGFVGSIYMLVEACRACCRCLCGRRVPSSHVPAQYNPNCPCDCCNAKCGGCCDCSSSCQNCGGCDDAGPLIVIVFLVMGIAMAFIGIWKFTKKVFEIYHQKAQLRDLSVEYEVMDLSDLRRVKKSARRSEEDHQRLLMDLQAQYAFEDTSAFRRRHSSVADMEMATLDREGAAPLAVEPASTSGSASAGEPAAATPAGTDVQARPLQERPAQQRLAADAA